VQEFVLLPYNHGKGSKSHSIHVQNPTKFTFSNNDLVWMFRIRHKRQNKLTIQFAYVPYARTPKFLEGEQRDTKTPVEWMFTNTF
jgi:hypothetical protein